MISREVGEGVIDDGWGGLDRKVGADGEDCVGGAKARGSHDRFAARERKRLRESRCQHKSKEEGSHDLNWNTHSCDMDQAVWKRVTA